MSSPTGIAPTIFAAQEEAHSNAIPGIIYTLDIHQYLLKMQYDA